MRLKIYYHIYGNPASEPIVSEQVNVICSSKLWETVESVECCVTGCDASSHAAILETLKRDKFRIRKSNLFDETFERFTLDVLLRDSELDHMYLYIHTKGCTQQGIHLEPVKAWRRCMEYFLIEKFPANLESFLAGEFDTAGIFLKTEPWPHYCGNFWWASGKYLKRRLFETPVIGPSYWDPEKYILDSRQPVKSLNLYEHPPMNLYDDVIPRSLYVIQVVSGIGFLIRNIFWICLSIVLLACLIRLVIRIKLRIIKQCN
jgi:hypothetical protein